MVALPALVSGLDAELVRLGYKDSTMAWYRGCWRHLQRYFAARGVEVLLQALGERGDPGQPGLAGGGHPLRQVLAGQLGDHGGERADLAGCGLEFGAAVQEALSRGFSSS